MPKSIIETIGAEIGAALSRKFPVACASDEFYFFPQVVVGTPRWQRWDCFAPEAVAETVAQLSSWQHRLEALPATLPDQAERIDGRLLLGVVRTLREQLELIQTWRTQPTFYLTIACVGMAEALAADDPDAPSERARGLAAFLDQGAANLEQVPELFRNLGLEMIADTHRYFARLTQTIPYMGAALAALAHFETALGKVSTRKGFQLPPELAAHMLKTHLGTGMDPDATRAAIDHEIDAMQQVLTLTAGAQNQIGRQTEGQTGNQAGTPLGGRASAGQPQAWEQVMAQIPLPAIDQRGLVGLYRDQLADLAAHCLEQGLVSRKLAAQCPVTVTPVPSFLSATRSASSYSIPAGYPPAGGTFYIINADDPAEARRSYQREYRILTAHETWPGHHLLDIHRWSHARPLRRVVERPLFYEGWACFAEELIHQTGYLHTGHDLMQLARRRLWRAVRGKVDLGLQTGSMGFEAAAEHLSRTGMDRARALSTARKYALSPGYQLCYTLGLGRFLDLFRRFGRDRPQAFAHTVLSQGEIDFDDLEAVLNAA